MTQASPETGCKSSPEWAPEGFKVWRPGTVAYRDAVLFQDQLILERPAWPYDLLILLEHPSVITLGRSADPKNLLWTESRLKNDGIDCITTRRGGDITLHGPGQLVGYPIVDLNHYQRDLHRFLRQIEAVLVATLTDFALHGEVIPGKTGVWTNGRKIASIGIAVQRWISYHGFALNIDNDLSAFAAIVPCGLNGVTMTSMSTELGHSVDRHQVSESLIRHFEQIMHRTFLGTVDDATLTPQT